MTIQHIIYKTNEVAGDGSQALHLIGRHPFNATEEWLKAQVKEPEIGDILTEVGRDVKLEQATEESIRKANSMWAGLEPTEGDDTEKKTVGASGVAGGGILTAGGKKVAGFKAKYTANPVKVEAYEIVSVGVVDEDGNLPLAISNGQNVKAYPEMTSRITPQVGDYWVMQNDGYVYLNPKAVFERKYSPVKS